MNIRVAREEDAQALLKIYEYYIRNTAITFEYEVPSVEEFQERIRGTLKNYPYLVAEENGQIVGYVYAGRFRPRAAFQWAAETSVYIDEKHHGKGLGKLFYEKLEEILRRQNVTNVYAVVAVPMEGDDEYLNRNSELFHEAMGYETVGRYHGCGNKFGRWYSLVVMEKSISDKVSPPKPFVPFPEVWELLGMSNHLLYGCQKNRTYPDRGEAEKLLKEAEERNPGPWGDHSRTTAHCAEKIAIYSGMNPEKAYVLGLLHDIGRRFGKRHLGHVSDGYSYMTFLGYSDAARICLTHSFNQGRIEAYVGNFDTTEEETKLIRTKLQETRQDDYDKLIQLCDSISGAEGVMDIIDRMSDVKRRYGAYDPEKWDANLALKAYFEQKMGKDLYEAVDKEHFKP